jgi:hypothetical protein
MVHRAATVGEMVHDLKTLVRLFVDIGLLEEAYAVAAALVIAGKADNDERQLFQQYRPQGVLRAHGRLNEDLWQRLIYHRDEDRVLSQIFAILGPAVAMARAKPAKDIGLKRKQQRDVNTDPTMVCKAFAYGATVMGVSLPAVYVVAEASGELDVANLRGTVAATASPVQPALVIGRKLLDLQNDVELAFVVGRTLAALRPDYLLRWPNFVPTMAELEVIVHAASRLVDPSRPVPGEIASEVDKYAAFLAKTMPPQLTEQLSVLIRRLPVEEGLARPTSADLAKWARAACMTTIRAGFLLSGDIEVAVRLGSSLGLMAGIEPADVARDLCDWSVSEGYFELRSQLGLVTVAVGYR